MTTRARARAYVALLYVGCLAGLYAGALAADRDGVDPDRFILSALLLLSSALAGARAWFVLWHRDLFAHDHPAIWNRRNGGMALYGGLLLSLPLSIPVVAATDLPLAAFWDAAAVTMLVGLVLTRIGCTVNGCCAGEPTTGRLALRLPDHGGTYARRRPTPLLEAAAGATILAAALAHDGDPDGTRFALVVAAYAAARLLLEGTRQQADLKVNGAVSALLLAGCAALLVLAG